MRSFFLVALLFLTGCGPMVSGVNRAVEDIFHMMSGIICGIAVVLAMALGALLVVERRRPKRRWYLPVAALGVILPLGLLSGAVWSDGFAPKPWHLSPSEIPWLWSSIAAPIAVAFSLPFFSARPIRRVVFLVLGAHLVFGWAALIVHCITVGRGAFGDAELADLEATEDFGCLLSRGGTLACQLRVMDVQPLSSIAVRKNRVCGIGKERSTVWCSDWFAGAAGPSAFWNVQGIDDAERIVLGSDLGCVVRRDQKISCFTHDAITTTYDGKDVALGDGGWLCLVGTDDRASCTISRMPRATFEVENATSVRCGKGFACALTKTREVVCSSGAPIDAGVTEADQLAVGDTHVCIRSGGSVRCGGWGSQVGVGDYELNRNLRTVALPGSAVDLHATPTTSCAKLQDGSLWCWGRNDGAALMTAEGEYCGFLSTGWCTPFPARVHID